MSTDAKLNEKELVARMRDHDDEAFEQLVRQYGPRMLAVARRFMSQDQDAYDVLQEAFLSAFKSIDKFNEDSKLGTWLHRIVVNAALMKLRSRSRKPEKAIDDLLPRFRDDGHLADPIGDWAVTHDTQVQQHETKRVVRAAIDELPEAYRTVLLLRDIEELSTEETAEVLGMTQGAVKTRLHRARQALREQLEPIMQSEAK